MAPKNNTRFSLLSLVGAFLFVFASLVLVRFILHVPLFPHIIRDIFGMVAGFLIYNSVKYIILKLKEKNHGTEK
jgi:hypothetical protein